MLRQTWLNTLFLTALSAFFLCCYTTQAQSGLFNYSKSEKEDYYAAENLFNKGYYEEALEKIHAYLEEAPDDLNAQSLQGWIYIKLDKYRDAKATFDHILQKDPKFLDALVGTGVYYRSMEEPEKALEYYQKALDIDPNDSAALSSIVVIALKSGEIDKAVSYGERSVEITPDDPVMNANLAVAYHYAKNYEKRDHHTKRAKELGYLSIETLEQIYSGEFFIVPPEKQ